MSAWEVGDLAVCVNNSRVAPLSMAPEVLQLGAVYKVVSVIAPALWIDGHCDAGLVIASAPNPMSPDGDWPERRFRKIRPDEHSACEAEFVTLLKRSKAKENA